MKKRIIPLLLASLSMFAIAGASAAGKELKAVGLTVGDMANPFFVAMGKGTEEAAKKINPNVRSQPCPPSMTSIPRWARSRTSSPTRWI